MDGGEFIKDLLQKQDESKQPLPPFSFVARSHAELSVLDVPKTSFIVPKLIPENGITAFSGEPGGKKTFFALHIASRVARGLPLFDEEESYTLFPAPPRAYPVLFIEEENDLSLVKERAVGLSGTDDIPVWYAVEQGFRLDDPEKTKPLVEFIGTHGIKLIIFDPFTFMHRMKSENEATEVAQLFAILRSTFLSLGCSLMFLHHPPKSLNKFDNSSSLRGSGDLLAKVDSHFVIRKQNDYHLIEQYKLRSAAQLETPLKVLFTAQDDTFTFSYGGEPEKVITEENDVKLAVVEVLDSSADFMSTSMVKIAVSAKFPYSDRTISNALTDLVKNNKIIRRKGTGSSRSNEYWTLTGSNNRSNNSYTKVE